MTPIQSDSKLEELEHYFESFLFDNHGLASRRSTKRTIKIIEDIKPDIIHLHCIHGYYINYKLLFNWLNSTTIPVVWTFHDCWAFTGHCSHFLTAKCEKWQHEGCHDCPLKGNYPKSLLDHSHRNFILKKELFTANRNLHIVAVSNWLASLIRDSFLGDKDIRVINNGVDIDVFKPCASKNKGKFRIIGVASAWGKDKGLWDFITLRNHLSESDFDIMLVGLTPSQIRNLPHGIEGYPRTNSAEELAKFYSQADVLVNPTYADSLPTVNIEALACGTPVITFRTGGSPDIIDDKTGVVVEQGDIEGLANAVKEMKERPLLSKDCRDRAINLYDKRTRFVDYLRLYEELLNYKFSSGK